MKIARFALLVGCVTISLASLWLPVSATTPAPVMAVDCVVLGVGCTTALRNSDFNGTTYPNGVSVAVSGYFSPNDKGGGTFSKNLGPIDCRIYSPTGTITGGSTQITNVTSLTGLVSGMAVSSSSSVPAIPPNDLIVSIDGSVPSNLKINLEVPLSGAGTTSVTLSISRDNGGSVIRDGETTPACFDRVSSTYGPKEWGAYQDAGTGAHDDTASLQNWMNASQPHIATPGNSIITSALTCNDGGVIQGSPTEGVAESTIILPTFQITASPSTTLNPFTGPAMLIMVANARCAIHGVGLIGWYGRL